MIIRKACQTITMERDEHVDDPEQLNRTFNIVIDEFHVWIFTYLCVCGSHLLISNSGATSNWNYDGFRIPNQLKICLCDSVCVSSMWLTMWSTMWSTINIGGIFSIRWPLTLHSLYVRCGGIFNIDKVGKYLQRLVSIHLILYT